MRPGQRGADSYLGFVGVTTGGSSINRVFPLWADRLGLPTRTLRGHDVAIGAPPQTYRDLVRSIRDDPRHAGALVTTHKTALYAAAADEFDELDELAVTFGEVSSIAKRGDRLTGAAKDPITASLALGEFLAPDHFSTTGGAALVLGSGGAGCALTTQLGLREDRPSEVICTAVEEASLAHAADIHRRSQISAGRMRYELTAGTDDADRLLDSLPPGSLVVNATGMGKDLPGSPLSPAAVFPERGVVWEFNYRGTLEFWHQARAQQADRRLVVEDGWRYFVHGWSQVIAEVFDLELSADTVADLSRIAAEIR